MPDWSPCSPDCTHGDQQRIDLSPRADNTPGWMYVDSPPRRRAEARVEARGRHPVAPGLCAVCAKEEK